MKLKFPKFNIDPKVCRDGEAIDPTLLTGTHRAVLAYDRKDNVRMLFYAFGFVQEVTYRNGKPKSWRVTTVGCDGELSTFLYDSVLEIPIDKLPLVVAKYPRGEAVVGSLYGLVEGEDIGDAHAKPTYSVKLVSHKGEDLGPFPLDSIQFVDNIDFGIELTCDNKEADNG